jgi:hypothetical protein
MQLEFGLKPNMEKWSALEKKVHARLNLHLGKEHGVKVSELAEDLNIKDARFVRLIIKGLTEKRGIAICSGNTGFYIPVTIEELEHYAARLRSQALSMLKRSCQLFKQPRVQQLQGQLSLIDKRMRRFDHVDGL